MRGLGSARSGGRQWWNERLVSVATLVLFVWLIASLVRLPSMAHGTLVEWLRDPLAAVPMLLLIAATFYHLKHGLQVVIEDYVHEEGNKLFAVLLLNFLVILGAALALFSVLKIAFGTAAS